MKKANEILLKTWLTGAVIILFCYFYASPVMASDICSVYDGAGHILTVEEGCVFSTGDVVFEFDTDYPEDRECFAVAILDEADNEDVLLPIPDGEWVVEEGEDTRLKFYILDEKDGSLKPLEIFPDGICSVFFLKDVSLEAKISFSAGEAQKSGNTVCYRGEAPELVISPKEGLFTFARITDKAGSKTYEITEEDTRFRFSEGSYGIAVWCENGKGESAFLTLPSDRFIYDNTPPASPKLSLEGDAPEEGQAEVYSGNIKLTPSSADSLSGIETYIFAFSDGSVSRGSSLVIEPDTSVNVIVYAVDRAGNLSEGTESGKLITDATAPVLTSDEISPEDGELRIELDFEDSLSGIRSLSFYADGKKTLSRSFPDGEEKCRLKTSLSPEELSGGTIPLKAVAEDRAGNRTVYGFELKNEDQSAPVIRMEGIDNLAVLSHGADLVCFCEDKDSGIERSSVLIEKRDEAGVSVWIREVSPGTIRFQEDGNYSVRFSAVDRAGNRTERSRSFTIDSSPPVITSLEAYHKKVLSSFSFPDDPGKYVSDYSFVTYQLYLNGKEYDGRDVHSPGKYVLRLIATDEFGRESQEKAEFLISANEAEAQEKSDAVNIGSATGARALLPVKTVKQADTLKSGKKSTARAKTLSEVKKTGDRALTKAVADTPEAVFDAVSEEKEPKAEPEKKLSLSDRFFRWLDRVLPLP
ncbi:MAG: Ig-like domain repeat protein [Lachnospiraceae bacterium]|nr:Ig-like domain repeat protein [Lachnospiraceae bacterium]